MKKVYFLLLILAANYAAAQNKEYSISMNGLGALRLGMSQAKAEELLNKKIALTKNYLDTLNGYYEDTANVMYKNIPVQLEFQRSYTAPNTFYMRLIGIRSSSPLCKTSDGLGVGSDNLKIVAAYNDYHINIQPGFYNYYATETGKGKSTIRILDDAASTMLYDANAYTLVFYLLNNKVVSFEIKGKLKEE